MKQFLARLIFHINIENEMQSAEFDEQLRVIESPNIEDAFFKARTVGKKEESVFTNAVNQKVHWQFIDVSELYDLNAVGDGDQLYSRSINTDDSGSFIRYVREKSIVIQTKSLTFA